MGDGPEGEALGSVFSAWESWSKSDLWGCIVAHISNKETQMTEKSRLPNILELFPFSAPQLQGTVGQQNPSLPEEMKSGDTCMCACVCAWACAHTRTWNYGYMCVRAHMCVCMHTRVPNRCAEICCKELVTVDKEIDRSQISRANGQAADNNCFHSLRTEFVLWGLSI